ncbi:MAG TPA: HAMP domain-containing sensor histidine kinase, partial [Prolixibacteraceae bacterium]|nr:HAMP domain-containing sensor histidine kinase [Prolixibacteraceae bacterium]
MIESKEVKGFALMCDNKGIVKSVLRDDFGIKKNNPVGKLFSNLVDSETRRHSLNFLLEIKQKKISIDYRLNFLINNKTHNFYFIGATIYDEVLIIAANNHKEAVDFTNHLQQINNEQANRIRNLLKKDTLANSEMEKETQQLFDEISKLNNELVNLQRQLTQKNKELERLNELKNRFIGMAAHDLRNPLGAIMNFSDFLQDELKNELSEQHLSFLQSIVNSSEFMYRLVEDLLDISIIESGKIQLNFEEFNIVEQLENIIENSNTLSKKKKIRITFNTELQSVILKADSNKLMQVFHNLIDNAVKFSPKESKVEVTFENKKKKVLVVVKDWGKGIAKGDQDKVFIPFTSIAS